MDSTAQSTAPETAIEVSYEPDYTIEDVVLAEPFIVLKPTGIGRPNWWSSAAGGKQKVVSLIEAFKMDMTVAEACVQAGITPRQYQYFSEIHKDFLYVKSRCKQFCPIVAKRGLLRDLQDHAKVGAVARQWYLERRQPETYGRNRDELPPPPGATRKLVAEAFTDEAGNIIISRKTAELIKSEQEHGDGEAAAGSGQ